MSRVPRPADPREPLCACEIPDPVMQADRRFYCHRCSFPVPAVLCDQCQAIVVVEAPRVEPPPNAERKGTMVTIDGRCGCSRCVERTENIYRMVGSCFNCGAKDILMLFRAGDWAANLDCPVCGNWHGVHAQRLAAEDEIPAPVPAAGEEPSR